MSRICFHSPYRTVEVHGAERHHLGSFTSRVGLEALGVSEFEVCNKDLFAALRPRMQSRDDLRLLLRIDHEQYFLELADGTRHNVWHLFLNACLRVGGSSLQLATRIHAQCEIHGWFTRKDKPWVKDAIASGLASGFYRKDMGWNRVLDLLSKDEDAPIVLSFSVCGSFPSDYRIADIPTEEWDDLSHSKKWEKAWGELRLQEDKHICENGVLFGTGMTAFEAQEQVRRGHQGQNA